MLQRQRLRGHVRSPENAVDYDAVIPFKHRLLEKAWSTLSAMPRQPYELAFDQFCDEQAHWLDDYALFRALKARYGGAYYLEWPAELVQREPPHALARGTERTSGTDRAVSFRPVPVVSPGARLREYARARGVRLIGDLPFFVSPDSSDVWANPELFLLG